MGENCLDRTRRNFAADTLFVEPTLEGRPEVLVFLFLDQTNQNWIWAEKDGKRGYVPSSFFSFLF